ncbi:MAG: YdiU family protein [Myxococcota bacterium]
MANTIPAFDFDNTFARELEGLYTPAAAANFPAPKLVLRNEGLAKELGLDLDELQGDAAARVFAGTTLPEGATPIAQAYAGHQFGGFSPQLGDGRALLLGEVVDVHGHRRDIQLKGSGPTGFSRGGDGKASLGPVLREYLFGEAMHALGIPTTRVLGVATTGEDIYRERALPGAVLARVASSHIRVGTFQFFAARRRDEELRRLADYTIARHLPDAQSADNPYLALLDAVAERQAQLTAKWMNVGFIHGVMNTDNVSIAGETIDYGPCAFMDEYDPTTVFSSIDRNGRYAYGNQPPIARWNIARLAEALLPLLAPDIDEAVGMAEKTIEAFVPAYQEAWLSGMRAKLGLSEPDGEDPALAEDLLKVMQGVDFTSAFRKLGVAARGETAPFLELFSEDAVEAWLERWQARVAQEGHDAEKVAASMDATNPAYIPRNHKTEEALDAAVDGGDLEPFKALLAAVRNPYDEKDSLADYAGPAPSDFGPFQTFCGT